MLNNKLRAAHSAGGFPLLSYINVADAKIVCPFVFFIRAEVPKHKALSYCSSKKSCTISFIRFFYVFLQLVRIELFDAMTQRNILCRRLGSVALLVAMLATFRPLHVSAQAPTPGLDLFAGLSFNFRDV